IHAGCAQEPVLVPLRSLERSGKVSYVCLGIPGDADGVVRPLSACGGQVVFDQNTFALDDAGTIPINHLYALVTQTSRGEVAVVDLTAQNGSVIDQNPGIPGANFLPVGAEPTDIVTTAGGTASFVTVAEVGRAGIFALPSAFIRPSTIGSDAGFELEDARPPPS